MDSDEPESSRPYKVLVPDDFPERLDEVIAYCLRAEGPKSASRFLETYRAVIERLSEIPGIAVKIGSSGYYWIPIETYVLVYSIDEEASTVKIHRLYYCSADWKTRILDTGN